MVSSITLLLALVAIAKAVSNGKAISRREAPYMVQLMPQGCSGTILDEWHVLSASHCFFTSDGAERRTAGMRVNAVSYNDDGSVAKIHATIPVKGVSIHPEFLRKQRLSGRTEPDVDIAVVKLSKPLILDGVTMKAVTLGEAPKEHSVIQIQGYGAIDSSPFRRFGYNPLQRGNFYLWDCAKINSRSIIGEGALCGLSKRTASCKGDSGGFQGYQGRQIAVTSKGTCLSKNPATSIGAAVWPHLDWIARIQRS